MLFAGLGCSESLSLLHTHTHTHTAGPVPASPQDTELLHGLNYQRFISGRKGGRAGEGAVNSSHQACPRKARTKCHGVSVPICLWGEVWVGMEVQAGRGSPKLECQRKDTQRISQRLTYTFFSDISTHSCVHRCMHTHT